MNQPAINSITSASGAPTFSTYVLTLGDRPGLDSVVRQVECGLGPVEVTIGINGKALTATEYYLEMVKGFAVHRNVLGPSEIGCAKSHVTILRRFLGTDAEVAVVFEDDVVFRPESFELLKKCLPNVGPNDLLVAGSQKIVEHLGPIYGRLLASDVPLYELRTDSRAVLKLAMSYAIGRTAAAHYCDTQERGWWPSDDFRVLSPPDGRLLFCDAFDHPVLTKDQSTTEVERLVKPGGENPKRLVTRLWEECAKTLTPRIAAIHGKIQLAAGQYQSIKKN